MTEIMRRTRTEIRVSRVDDGEVCVERVAVFWCVEHELRLTNKRTS